MHLTFRNHGRLRLPAFTNSDGIYFFESNTSTEQVNVIHITSFISFQKWRGQEEKGDSFSCDTACLWEMSCPDINCCAGHKCRMPEHNILHYWRRRNSPVWRREVSTPIDQSEQPIQKHSLIVSVLGKPRLDVGSFAIFWCSAFFKEQMTLYVDGTSAQK